MTLTTGKDTWSTWLQPSFRYCMTTERKQLIWAQLKSTRLALRISKCRREVLLRTRQSTRAGRFWRDCWEHTAVSCMCAWAALEREYRCWQHAHTLQLLRAPRRSFISGYGSSGVPTLTETEETMDSHCNPRCRHWPAALLLYGGGCMGNLLLWWVGAGRGNWWSGQERKMKWCGRIK